jgi:hypothetical protein
MKALLHSLRARARHCLLAFVATAAAAATGTVHAQLPTPIDPNIGGRSRRQLAAVDPWLHR